MTKINSIYVIIYVFFINMNYHVFSRLLLSWPTYCSSKVKMKRIGSIQGLKGIAAFVVFLSHVFMTYKSDLVTSLKYSPFHFFFDGECSVMIFFAISGFFYYNSKPSSISSYFSGVKKKIIKIYPPYIIIMMIGYFFLHLFILTY